MPWPKLWVARSMRAHVLAVAQDARRLVGQLDPGALPEAELAQPGVVALAPEAIADLGRADVARELDHLGERQPAVRMRVVNRPLAERASRRSRRTARSVGLTMPCSIALAARIALNVEPGLVGIGQGAVADAVLVARVAPVGAVVRIEGRDSWPARGSRRSRDPSRRPRRRRPWPPRRPPPARARSSPGSRRRA